MPRWTVSFETHATVNVEAETENEAREAARKTLKAMSLERLRVSEVCHCSVNVSASRDE